MLNYHHLRYFWIVAHEGNLTRAAKKISIAQSSLSMQIQKLERDLGVDLFERSGRQLRLTEAGRITLDFANTIFATGDELLGTLGQVEGSARRVLRVGALATLSRNFQIHFLSPILQMEGVEVMIRSGTFDELLIQLESFQIDVLLSNVSPPRQDASSWVAHAIDNQPVSLIGSPHARWANKTLQDLLLQEPLVLPSPPSSIRSGFDALVSRLGIKPHIVAEVDDMAMLRLVAREHEGLAVVPPIVVKDELDSGHMVEVAKLPGLVETFFAVTFARRYPNRVLDLLLQ
ncbi:MAG: LysR family transcriptional regulator [Chloroflexota bacterium]